MRRINLGISITLIGLIGLTLGGILVFAQIENPLSGKIIALDAGHGGENLGAQYPATCADDGDLSDCRVYEKDINIVTIHKLKDKLEADGAYVVLSRECDETISGNKERVDMLKEKCANLDIDGDGNPDNQECDVLVSVHHNGNVDATYDGLLVIYNSPVDKKLAIPLHDRLLTGLFNGNSSYDEGYDKGGYGMTVYFSPSSLSESYYVTNKCEAEIFSPNQILTEEEWNRDCPAGIYGTFSEANATSTNFSCSANGASLDFNYGPKRVNQEADALYWGLYDYFNSSGSGNGGGNGGGKPDAPPGRNK